MLPVDACKYKPQQVMTPTNRYGYAPSTLLRGPSRSVADPSVWDYAEAEQIPLGKHGHRPSRITTRVVAATTLALIYASLMAAFPFESAFNVGFSDRDNYLWNYENVYLLMNNDWSTPEWLRFGDDPLDWILRQSLFSYLFVKLASACGSPQAAQQVIAFFSAFVVSRFTLTRSPLAVSLLLLFSPLLVDFFVSTQRQSLAFAAMLLAWPALRYSKLFSGGTIFVTSMIHLSFVLLGPLIVFQRAIYRGFFKSFTVVGIGLVALAGVVAYQRFGIDPLQLAQNFSGSEIALRQDEYSHLVTGWSYTTIWLIYLSATLWSGKAFVAQPLCFPAVFLIASFVVLQFSGLSGIRLLPIAYPFALISVQYFDRKVRHPFICAFALYNAVYWVHWTQNSHWLTL